MSYFEYFDLYKIAQTKNCPYKAFCIDVVNSKKVMKQDPKRQLKMFKLFDYISLELLKKNKNSQVFRNNKNNQLNLVLKNINYDKNFIKKYDEILKNVNNLFITNLKQGGDTLLANPMITGDCACYFINDGTLTDKEFLSILKIGIEKFDIDFDFHFLSGKYETDNYTEGGNKFYKGYVREILEHFSKKQGITISHNVLEK